MKDQIYKQIVDNIWGMLRQHATTQLGNSSNNAVRRYLWDQIAEAIDDKMACHIRGALQDTIEKVNQ